MKIPQQAPNEALSEILNDERFPELFRLTKIVDEKGRYFHWDEVRLRPLPSKFKNLRQYWGFLRLIRNSAAQLTPLFDKHGDEFCFVEHDEIKRALHEIDSNARGKMGSSSSSGGSRVGKTHYIQSLFEEPFSSSVLEGAATTRDVAKKLMQDEREPINEHERMVLNNYLAMEFIKNQTEEQLTPEIVHELHRIVTNKTLADEDKAGCFRTASDNIVVGNDIYDEVYHTPPQAAELENRLSQLCDFANGKGYEKKFIHPIIKAIILHFMLAYDHPYVDGNGRAARALFYWSVIRDGYWFLEYISISGIIKQAPIQYGKAFLFTETDSADLTYFIDHQINVITKAIDALHEYLDRKNDEIAEAKDALESLLKEKQLNHRQVEIVMAALKNPTQIFTVKEHEKKFNISYITAKKDFSILHELKILNRKKVAQTYRFKLNPNRTEELSKIKAS